MRRKPETVSGVANAVAAVFLLAAAWLLYCAAERTEKNLRDVERLRQDVQVRHELVVSGPPFRVRNAWGQDPGWTDVEVRP